MRYSVLKADSYEFELHRAEDGDIGERGLGRCGEDGGRGLGLGNYQTSVT